MDQVNTANILLSEIEYPIEVKFDFDESGANLISSNDKGYKITLGVNFFIQKENNSCILSKQDELNALKIKMESKIKSIKINSNLILEIYLDDYLILSFPGIYFGWGIYKNKKQIIQYEGWDNGLEFGTPLY